MLIGADSSLLSGLVCPPFTALNGTVEHLFPFFSSDVAKFGLETKPCWNCIDCYKLSIEDADVMSHLLLSLLVELG